MNQAKAAVRPAKAGSPLFSVSRLGRFRRLGIHVLAALLTYVGFDDLGNRVARLGDDLAGLGLPPHRGQQFGDLDEAVD